MSVVTSFWKFIQGKLLGNDQYTVTSNDISDFIDKNKWNQLAIYDFALHSGINIIAYALSKCEFRTFLYGEEVKSEEYFLWNYQPNQNENASQFMQKLVWCLIYKNECLVVPTSTGDLLIADSFEHTRYALYPDTFSNVVVCMEDDTGVSHSFTFKKTFRMNEVLYFKLSNRNITNLLDQLITDYDELLKSAINKFYKSGGERGILTISGKAPQINYGTNSDGTPRTFNQVYNEMMNKEFGEYFKSPNAVMTLWDGFTYDTKGGEANKKSTSEIKDVTDITDEIYDKVANALQIPPALLKGDVADVTALTKNLLTFGIDPLAKMIEREINRKRNGRAVLRGTSLMIDTSGISHIDAFDIAPSADKMIASGGWSIDEIRKKAGDAPLNTEWSQRHWMTKNYTTMDALDDGGTDPPEDKTNESGGEEDEDAETDEI